MPTRETVGSYTLYNVFTGFCVDLDGTGPAGDDAQLFQNVCLPGKGDNQDFELDAYGDQFVIRNISSNRCIDGPGFGDISPNASATVYTCRPGFLDNQMFTKVKKGGGYFLKNVKGGLCLNVADNDHLTAQKLTYLACSTTDDHIWALR